jgi:hypothetical protein
MVAVSPLTTTLSTTARKQSLPNADERSRSRLPMSVPKASTWLGKIRSTGRVCNYRKPTISINTFSGEAFAS